MPLDCLEPAEAELYLKGKLSLDRQQAIEGHLSECQSCLSKLTTATGGEQWWSDLETALRAEDSMLVDRAVEERASLLELLGPSDYPGMLGRIGSYEIVELLGQGGMGAVFKAFDSALNRYVALKILLPQLATSAAARKRFRREGQSAAALVNEHVLPIYAVDEWRGIPYLVTQFVPGTTLQVRLARQGPLALREILRISLHAARGLAAAHRQGLIHRDIKPSNILLEGGVDRALLADFGLARAADDASLTRSGILAGTPQYMSPEQVCGEPLDQRSDLFSMGSVIYTMCTGQPPFQADSSYSVMRRIVDELPRPICHSRPDLPPWLEQLTFWLMAKRPDERLGTAENLERILEQCLAHVEQPESNQLPKELRQSEARRTGLFSAGTYRLIALAAAATLLLAVGAPWLIGQKPKELSQDSAGTLLSSTLPGRPVIAADAKDIINSIGMSFKRIPEGTFLMGSVPKESGRFPDETLHEVTLTKPFFIGVTEVTQRQYLKVVKLNPSKFIEAPESEHSLPVERVTWQDAIRFCEILSGFPEEVAAGRSYRLPTEAEWEYACRANSYLPAVGQAQQQSLEDYAWLANGPNGRPASVAGRLPNPWGLCDMQGNLFEWCADYYADYPASQIIDPRGPSEGFAKVFRGGSWANDKLNCRPAFRGRAAPDYSSSDLGFRVVLEVNR